MAIRVNPKLIDELERYGAEDVSKCYHCGNCSAVCPHSSDPFIFPRRSMRTLQMGLEEKLVGSLEPWLCYYCGQCSEQCPREAEPGETMMSLRRWLTSRYDFTGISKLFYRSWKAELFAILFLAIATAAGFFAWGSTHGDIAIYDGEGAFLQSEDVHLFDWGMAGLLVLLLGIGSLRMWWFTVLRRKDISVPFTSYFKAIFAVPYHFLTQPRYAQCGSRGPWAVHLVLMLSYVIMFVLIMFFLHEVQSGPEIDWKYHAFGYAASIGLIATVIYSLRSRIKKDRPQTRHSHESDWIFLFLLLYVATTGVLQHVLHRTGQEMAANIVYVVHMAGVVPMLVLEVPFSKWSHLAYRPLGMFFSILVADGLRAKARASSDVGAGSPQPARVA
ncbi:MAG: 4Fe-4S dicluster domain-containing protein [Proteobacteria bacterium]|jgi:ferredoxin|nr:4Fe-4S dicluster domain-containing protein [Pseudomonadota bacterium]